MEVGMPSKRVLLFTDVEGSTQLTERLGDVAASALWSKHDRVSRQLLRHWGGREIDKSDGFLLVFSTVSQAIGFAAALHGALGSLQPAVRARVAIHCSELVERENTSDEVTLGAKPLELDGVGKALTARIMSIAHGGQTLLSSAARNALADGPWNVRSHGHWRMKGIADPIEVFECGSGQCRFTCPGDSDKAFRVVRRGATWTCVSDLPNSLPAERDAFVGRDEALDSLATALQDRQRLVTIVGIGGIGKTRLALRYAQTWLGAYAGGCWFCDLSSAASLDGILLATAQGLGVPLGTADPVRQIGASIAGRGPCLVVLDNFEQVARHAESTIGEWLKRAPDAQFVVTSREVLGIAGEQTQALAPLPIDEAIHLFDVRASAAQRIAATTASGLSDVTTLVELLDRLPLAIELAAARVRLMTPRAMLERMNERFRLLASAGGRRERQATLRATLDWSWDLLSVAERSALAQLSVFEGGSTLAAAEAVVKITPSDDEAPWLVDVLQGLVDKSLLRNQNERLEMLRSVQEYAAERLISLRTSTGESAANGARERHWRHFALLDETDATAARCAESENLIAACRRAATLEPSSAVGALAGAAACLQLVGPFRAIMELVLYVERSGRLTSTDQVTVDRVAASALLLLGDVRQSIARCDSGLRHATMTADVSSTIRLKCLVATSAMNHGNLEGAREHLAEAMQLMSDQTDTRARVRVLSAAGALHQRSADFSAAARDFEEARALAAQLNDKRWLGGLHGNLGAVAQEAGQLDEALLHLEKGIAFARESGDRQREGNNRCNLGLLLLKLGRPQDAKAELMASLDIANSIGYRRLAALAVCNLGSVEEMLGEQGLAAAKFLEAFQLAEALGDKVFAAEVSSQMALALARDGRLDQSRRRFEEALSLADQTGDALVCCIALCRQAIAARERGDEPGWKASFDRASSLLELARLRSDSALGALYVDATVPPDVADRFNR